MKRIITLLLIVSVAFSLIGCNLLGAANVYDRYELDADGNEIRVQVMHAPGNKSEIWVERYHNKDGWLEREINYDVDATGRIASEILFRENGSRITAKTYFNNMADYSVEEFDENDVRISTHNYQNGSLISIEEYYPSGAIYKLTDYTDIQANVKIWTYSENGDSYTLFLSWSDPEKLTEELDFYVGNERVKTEMKIITRDGEFVARYVDEYRNNEIVKTTHYDKDGNVYDVVEHH